jgi:hypothetical protein
VERALQILQCGQVWSSEPLDCETLRTLKDLAGLSPIRSYYPPGMRSMEVVCWPYSPLISSEAIRLVVEKLLADSLRLKFLFPDVPVQEIELPSTEVKLSSKAYWRRCTFGTELGKISFDEEFAEPPQVRKKGCKLLIMAAGKELDRNDLFSGRGNIPAGV